jgi:hypothetical protein
VGLITVHRDGATKRNYRLKGCGWFWGGETGNEGRTKLVCHLLISQSAIKFTVPMKTCKETPDYQSPVVSSDRSVPLANKAFASCVRDAERQINNMAEIEQ